MGAVRKTKMEPATFSAPLLDGSLGGTKERR